MSEGQISNFHRLDSLATHWFPNQQPVLMPLSSNDDWVLGRKRSSSLRKKLVFHHHRDPHFRSGNTVSIEPRPSMISVPDADLSPAPSRYYAADFHKLTNRRASSPSTPDYALPNRVMPARTTLPPADTADRRAFSRQDASPCVVQGAPAISRARQGSGSSIKEDAGGEITRNFVNIITRPPSIIHCVLLQS
ncbi:MAG: hypothetical protein Q9184_000892 [Pyrenodesmia sp. 2 TL-2023]